jgi:DNA-binding GntR family transcriptional regulator
MLDIIQKHPQLPVGKILQNFEARTADSEIAGQLSIGILDPVFYVESFAYGPKEEPILYTQMYHKGNRHKYSIELHSNGKFINTAHP